MDQVPGMLWLAALMGLLAACAFSFLLYLVFRRPHSSDTFEAESPPEYAGQDGAAAFALAPAAEFAAEPFADVAPGDTTGIAAGEDEGSQTPAFDLAVQDQLQDEDDTVTMSAALGALDAAEPDTSPLPTALVESERDWFATGDDAPEFVEFDPQEDDLVLVWDDATGGEPAIQVRCSDEDPAITQVLLGDVIVAQVRAREHAVHDHVSLMPFSLARTLGWAQA